MGLCVCFPFCFVPSLASLVRICILKHEKKTSGCYMLVIAMTFSTFSPIFTSLIISDTLLHAKRGFQRRNYLIINESLFRNKEAMKMLARSRISLHWLTVCAWNFASKSLGCVIWKSTWTIWYVRITSQLQRKELLQGLISLTRSCQCCSLPINIFVKTYENRYWKKEERDGKFDEVPKQPVIHSTSSTSGIVFFLRGAKLWGHWLNGHGYSHWELDKLNNAKMKKD